MNVTIKLSGHILFPSLAAKPDIKSYVKCIKEISGMGHKPSLVIGGGAPARHYITIARENGADESTCDQIGIAIANLNAKLFVRALGDYACQFVPTNLDELDKALSTGRVVIMGGLQPGQSTNAVASILAERSSSKLLINTTTVDGIYTGDPKKDRSVKKFTKITITELAQILADLGSRAGEYDLLDPVALKIIQRSKITTKVIDGSDPKNILRAIKGEDIGTTIVP